MMLNIKILLRVWFFKTLLWGKPETQRERQPQADREKTNFKIAMNVQTVPHGRLCLFINYKPLRHSPPFKHTVHVNVHK